MSKTKEKQTITTADVGAFPMTEMPPASNGPLVPAPPADLAAPAMSEAAAAFLQDAKGKREVPSKIPIIGIDHKAGNFVLPSGEVVESVAGYPVYYFQTRRYYKKPPQAGAKGSPPDCWSADLVVPHNDSLDKQAETCGQCQLNEFGTGRDGKSKACGTFTWVFLLNPAFGTPPLGVLVAPPSSIRALLGTRFQPGYFSRAAAKHQVYEIVFTQFRLKTEGDQVQYCTLEPIMGEVCKDVEQVRRIAAVRNQFLAAMESLRGLTPQATANGGGE